MDKRRFQKQLRTQQTEVESTVWYHLRAKRFERFKFRRQVLIAGYIVDFVCHAEKLIIELDGCQHQLQQEYDRIRTKFLVACGYKVIRFWNNQILFELDSVLNIILKETCECNA